MSIASSPTPQPAPLLRIPTRVSALKISLGYAGLGALWVLCSGWLLHRLVQSSGLEVVLETLKGWGYVSVTAFLLWLVLDRYFRLLRQSALQLQAREVQLRLVGDNLPNGYLYQYGQDASGKPRFTYVSAGVERVHGVSPADVLGDANVLQAQMDLAQRSALAAAEAESARTLSDIQMDLQIQVRDGSSRRLRICSRPRRNADGLIQWDGFALDVTERQQLEREREVALSKYRTLFNSLPIGITLADPQGRIVESNRLAEEILGLPSKGQIPQHIGGPEWRIVRPDGTPMPPEEFASVRALRRQCLVENVEVGLVKSPTDITWITVTAAPVSLPEAGVVITYVDISSRKRAEQALRKSEWTLRQSQRLANIGNWEWNLRTGEVHWSAEIYAMNGLQPEAPALTPDTLLKIVHPDDVEKVKTAIAQAVTTGSPADLDYRIVRADGSLRVIHAVGAVTEWDAEGRPLIMLGTNQDITERKQAETALRESELRRELAMEAAGMGTWDWDVITGKTTWSERHERLWGYAPGQYPGTYEGYISRVHPEDLPHVLQTGEAALRQRQGYSCEYRVVWPDGTERWVAAHGRHFLDDRGQCVRMVGIVLDITERKRVEASLQANADRLAAVLNAQRRISSANVDYPALLRLILECASNLSGAEGACLEMAEGDELVYEAVTGLAAPFVGMRLKIAGSLSGLCMVSGQPMRSDDVQTDPRVDRAACQRIGLRSMGLLPLRYDDHSFGVLKVMSSRIAAFSPAAEQTLQMMGEFLSAAIARQRAEQALRESEARFRRVVETAPEAIFIRTNLEFTYLNAAALKLFGAAAAEQLLGTSVLERFHPDCRENIHGRIRRLDEQGESTALAEQVWLRLDGTPINVIVSAVVYPYQGQRSALVFARDVTEYKRLEEQLRQAQKLEAVGQLAGGIAHDFNNILAAIMMHLGLLQLNPALDEDVRNSLQELEAEARRAASLTRQLLMFSRRSVLAVKPLDLNEVIANLLKMLRRLIGEQIDLRFEGQTGLPPVQADAGMLEQVLMNLVVNARDAMPRGGRITIRTALVELGETEVAGNPARQRGRFICLAVSDTGTGMQEATLQRIFEPFFTTKEAGKGTGLGLATVHGIVAQHKGWVEVESQIDRGTTFRVFLPAALQRPAPPAEPGATTTLLRGQETILLVEDEPKVRQMVGQALRLLGYRVYPAANGQEAMALWLTHGEQVDLLVTDMVMPEGMTGLELTERLQAMRPGLKAIISSGYSAEIVQAGVPNKTGLTYLPKPYTTQTLAQVVRNCLDQGNHPPGVQTP